MKTQPSYYSVVCQRTNREVRGVWRGHLQQFSLRRYHKCADVIQQLHKSLSLSISKLIMMHHTGSQHAWTRSHWHSQGMWGCEINIKLKKCCESVHWLTLCPDLDTSLWDSPTTEQWLTRLDPDSWCSASWWSPVTLQHKIKYTDVSFTWRKSIEKVYFWSKIRR